MTRLRLALGLLACGFLLVSFGAHTFLGWPALQTELAQTTVPVDLMGALRSGWIFGGVAMAGFGLIAGRQLVRAWRGVRDPAWTVGIIAAVYIGFGLWAMLGRGSVQPFYLVFVVPGLMLAAAAGAVAEG